MKTGLAEKIALEVAPEGCDGQHPKGGCLFEKVRDAVQPSARIVEEFANRHEHTQNCHALAGPPGHQWHENEKCTCGLVRARGLLGLKMEY